MMDIITGRAPPPARAESVGPETRKLKVAQKFFAASTRTELTWQVHSSADIRTHNSAIPNRLGGLGFPARRGGRGRVGMGSGGMLSLLGRLARLGPTLAKLRRPQVQRIEHLRKHKDTAAAELSMVGRDPAAAALLMVGRDPDLARLAGIELVRGPCICNLQSSENLRRISAGATA